MIHLENIKKWEELVNNVVCGNCIDFCLKIPDKSVDTVVTSPPYWKQRDYEVDDQWGWEDSCDEYVEKMCNFFDFYIGRILKTSGSCWVNIGDCFNENSGGYFETTDENIVSFGKHRVKVDKYQKKYPRRSLLMIPYRFAIGMMDRGWLVRDIVIWRKKIVTPTSAQNRFTNDYEPIFLITKNMRYFFNKDNVKWIYDEKKDIFGTQSRKERRDVWDLSSDHSGKTNHKAPYPIELAEIPILATCPEDGIVFDPFLGSGTTAVAALKNKRNFLGCELSPNFCDIADERISSFK